MAEAVVGTCGRQLPHPRQPYNRGTVLKMLIGKRRAADRRCDAVPCGRDRRPRAEIRRRHHHPSRLCRVRHRRQQARATLLRRGRGRLAEALRDLGPPRRRPARPDRLHRLRRVFARAVHALAVPADRGRLDHRARGQASTSIRQRSRRRSPTSMRRCGPEPSTTRSSTIAATEGLTPPKTHWARRIETPPFYAYPVRPGITFTYLGTRVNREARMLMTDGRPAKNMFAAGEIMAGNVLGQRLRSRYRHDDRQRVRPHRGTGGGASCRQIACTPRQRSPKPTG